ncbi:MAG: LysM peptidoglycan-binding domain-containing protein [Spirochaetota bacterium]|nr:LysM peptidoglycan-binding domain-containing protein [Spirochaetota bacterium]
MSRDRRNINVILFIFLISIISSCSEKVPIKEMSLARLEITRALSVKAEKYAQDEISEAKKELLECHNHIKSDQLDKAKSSAIHSHRKALEAYNKSIPLLAKDTIDSAEEKISEAEEAYAEELSSEEYENAANALIKAKELYEQRTFYESYEKAKEAIELAEISRDIALGKKDLLNDSIAEVRLILEDSEKYDAEKYAPENTKLANENIEIAENSLQSLKLKEGFSAIETARMNADEAFLLALKGISGENISSAENLLNEASNSEGASIAQDELGGAKEALALSKNLFSENKYIESISAADESKRFAYIVLNTKKVVVEEVTTKGEEETVSEEDTILKEKEYHIYKVRYIPRRRDCLWRIAERFYNNPWLWRKIYRANRDKIYDPDLIWPDMLLKVPILGKSTEQDEKKIVEKREEEAIEEETLDEEVIEEDEDYYKNE